MPVPKEMVLRLSEPARIRLTRIELDNPTSNLTRIINYCGRFSSKGNYSVVPRVIKKWHM